MGMNAGATRAEQRGAYLALFVALGGAAYAGADCVFGYFGSPGG